MNIQDGVCAYVGGGLGNQLFILAAAWSQAARLDSPLYLDTSFSTVRGTRPFELDTLGELPGTVLGEDSPWRSIRVSPMRVLPLPRLRHPVRRPIFRERDGARYDPSVERIRPGTTMFGYFQSPKYFERVATGMKDLLLEAPLTPDESHRLEEYRQDPRVSVHLRRGDYLDAPVEQRVLATSSYTARALRLLKRLGVEAPLRVFSDSPELVRMELRDLDANIEIVADPHAMGPVATIRSMADAPALVMANSTFSWWAAWLLRQLHGPEAVVISPRPWDHTGTAKADLLEPDWLTLDVR